MVLVDIGPDRYGAWGTEVILDHRESWKEPGCEDDPMEAHPEELALCVNIKFAAPVISFWSKYPLKFCTEITYNVTGGTERNGG